MSTFLEIVQALAREVDLASSPSAVTSQTGEFGDLVRWTQQAYRDIERRHDWRWLRRTAQVTTTIGDSVYASSDFTDTTDSAAISRFRKWRIWDPDDPPKIYEQSVGVGGERWLVATPWEWFKSIYRIGTQANGAPAHISVDPADNVVIGPAPSSACVVTVDYYMGAQTLSADADEPEMPADFHDLIVYYAMTKYAYREAAPEALSRAKEEQRRMLRRLEALQLEPLRLAGPMA